MSNTNSTDDFLKGNFELNCPKIEIIPVLTGTNRKSLTGSGVISINDNGYFNIKVFFPETFSLSETFESQKWEAGKIIDDEYFYNIVAYDINGQVWYAERFIPDRSSGPNGSIIIGKVPELHRVQEYPASTEKNYLQLFFNETIDIPLNTAVKEQIQIGDKTRDVKQSLRIARFKCLDIDFEIDTANGNTVISAVSDKIDFTDVGLFASPFFNASIGLLLKDIDISDLQKNVTFINLSEVGRQLLNHVISNAIKYYDKESNLPEMLQTINKNPVDE